MTTDQGGTVEIGFKPSMDEPSKPSDFDSPLLDYWCEGAGYVVRTGISKPKEIGQQGRQWRRVEFRGRLGQGDVIKTTGDVYPHPFASISLFYNEPKESYANIPGRGVSDWEALSGSVRAIWVGSGREWTGWECFEEVFGGPITDPESGQMPSKMGMRYHMMRVPTLLNVGPDLNSPNPAYHKWHDEVKPAWQVVEIEGVGKAGEVAGEAPGFNLKDYVLDMMDGKTVGAFMAEAAEDEKIMANESLVDQLTNDTFIKTMTESKLITVDEAGIIHKV